MSAFPLANWSAPSTPSCSTQLLNFKRGIKRDISAYPTLKDEKYYESFKRSMLVTARAHDCEEIGRDIPLNAPFEVQELNGTRGG